MQSDSKPNTHTVTLPMFSAMKDAPTKRYRTIVADPPWRYDDKLGDGPRGAASHYGTMSLPELMSMPVGLWAETDSHLYLWTTNAFMVDAHKLAESWGFTTRTILTWVKSNGFGLGHYYRNSTEHALFGVRGKLQVLNHDQPTHFMAPRGAHSEKPAAFYDMVERMSLGPYLDVFARTQRFNWDTFGDEAFDFREHGIWHDGARLAAT